MIAEAQDSVVVVIDVQPSFLAAVPNREAVVRRTGFLLQCARLLGVPALATEQYPQRMGPTEPSVAPLLAVPASDKMCFSACGCESFVHGLGSVGRKTAIVAGIETHICITQTSLDLLDSGFVVFVCADAVGARTQQAHDVGLRRLAHAGCILTHTESVVYEWMRSADHASFREVLQLVKES